ncbi:ArnT family glycosyltransferase [bacterium]
MVKKNIKLIKPVFNNQLFTLTKILPSYILYILFFIYVFIMLKMYFNDNVGVFSNAFTLFFKNRTGQEIEITNILFGILRVLKYSLLSLFIFAGCSGYGKLMKEKVLKLKISFLTDLCANFGLGIASIILYIVLLSFFKLLILPMIIIFLIIGTIFFFMLFDYPLADFNFRKAMKTDMVLGPGTLLLIVVVLLLLGLVTVIPTSVPETFYDSLVYHLGLPQKWIFNKGIYYDSFSSMASVPLNLEVFYSVGLMLKDSILAKYQNLILAICFLLLLYDLSKRYFGKTTGLLAVLMYLSTSNVGFLIPKTSIEIGLGFFDLLALVFVINWMDSEDTQIKLRSIFAAGIFQGLSLGTKYLSFFTTFALICVISISLFRNKEFKKSYKYLLVFCCTSFLVACPWYIRNLLITGNPVYPMFSNIIGHLKNRFWQRIKGDPVPIKYTFSNLLFFPWKLTLSKISQETFLGPFYILFIPFLFLIKKIYKHKVFSSLFIYFLVHTVLWLFLGRLYVRFFVPGLSVGCLVLIAVFVKSNINLFIKKILVYLIIFISILNLLLLTKLQAVNMNPIECFLGLVSDSQYLSTSRKSYPSAYYKAVEFFNGEANKEDKILLVGETRCTFFNNSTVLTDPLMHHPIIEMAKKSKNEEELLKYFKEDNIKYIFINTLELKRLSANWDMFYWDARDLIVFDKFINKYAKTVYKYCPDMLLDEYISKNKEFWAGYKKNALNSIFVYEVVDSRRKQDEIAYNYLILPKMYNAQRFSKIFSDPIMEKYLSKNYRDLKVQGFFESNDR